MEALAIRLRTRLYALRLRDGGWPFNVQSTQMALEPSCLALVALHSKHSQPAQILSETQRPDGGWESFAGDQESSGLTGLALLTLNTLDIGHEARSRAGRWLLEGRGPRYVKVGALVPRKQADLEWRSLTVGRTKTDASEGRTIPLNSALYEALKEHLDLYTCRFGHIEPQWYLSHSVICTDLTRPAL